MCEDREPGPVGMSGRPCAEAKGEPGGSEAAQTAAMHGARARPPIVQPDADVEAEIADVPKITFA